MRNEWNGRVQKEKWNISLQIIYTFPSRFVPCSELKDEIFGIILVTWIEIVTSETWHIIHLGQNISCAPNLETGLPGMGLPDPLPKGLPGFTRLVGLCDCLREPALRL